MYAGKCVRNIKINKMSLLDKEGEIIKKSCRIANKGTRVKAIITSDHLFCCELYSRVKSLGRITLRND